MSLDLTSYSYLLKTPVATVKNVGWLSSQHSFQTGVIEKEVLAKLAKIITSSVKEVNFHVNKIRGAHECVICGCEGILLDDVVLGSSELWIPSDKQNLIYAAPSLIYHYIEKHGYCPPSGFLDAVKEVNLFQVFNAQELYLETILGHF